VTPRSPYEVAFKKSAEKELLALPKRIQQQIVDAIRLLAINPRTELLQIKKLKGAENLFRVRVNDYRVLYTIADRILKVTVVKLGHRRSVYE
jgi:mRNA interferase RelE/StbE